MKFKIGSKVRIIKNEYGAKEYDKYIGREVKVMETSSDGYCELPIPTQRNSTFWQPTEIELVKEPKKAKKEKGRIWL